MRIIRVDDIRDYVVAVGLVALVAIAFLVIVDMVTDHEVPELPDCQEDEVLDHVVYDDDPTKRTYECVHVENIP